MNRTFLSALLAGAALAALAANTTQAADLPSRAPMAAVVPAPMFSWTGFYVGANLGYGWVDDASDADGAFAGGQLGYNLQFGSFVVGLEGDLNYSWIDGSAAPFAFDLDWFGTVRGRVGVALDRFMIYGTGGFAWGNFDVASPIGSDDNTQWGWTLGAGVEAALWDNWSAKLEYKYINFDSETYFGGTPFAVSVNPDIHTVALGINYRF